MSRIDDKNISCKIIQPIRFFRNTYGTYQDKRNYNYFESAKKNIYHQLCNVPNNTLIKFQLEFPAYYVSLTECKIYCPDRTTVLFDIKANVSTQDYVSLTHYGDSNGDIVTKFIFNPNTVFANVPVCLGVIRVIATDGITPITWESDLINIFNVANVYHNNVPYDNETDLINSDLNIPTV